MVVVMVMMMMVLHGVVVRCAVFRSTRSTAVRLPHACCVQLSPPFQVRNVLRRVPPRLAPGCAHMVGLVVVRVWGVVVLVIVVRRGMVMWRGMVM